MNFKLLVGVKGIPPLGVRATVATGLLFVLMVLHQTSHAQVHLKKQTFIEFGAGGFDAIIPNQNHFSSYLSIGKYNAKGNGNSIGFGYNQKFTSVFDTQNSSYLNQKSAVQHYQFFYKTDWSLYSNAMNDFHIRAVGRLNIGYEALNRGNAQIGDYQLTQKSAFLLGVGVGIEMEYSPLVVGFQQQINVLSDYQKFSSVPYLGLRFHLKNR
jgi:hypothetical protein